MGGLDQSGNGPAVAIGIAILTGIMGATLVVAGAPALSGRSAYLEWR